MRQSQERLLLNRPLRYTTDTSVGDSCAAEAWSQILCLIFWSWQFLKKMLFCNNKKEDLGEILFLSKHDKHYIQSW